MYFFLQIDILPEFKTWNFKKFDKKAIFSEVSTPSVKLLIAKFLQKTMAERRYNVLPFLYKNKS